MPLNQVVLNESEEMSVCIFQAHVHFRFQRLSSEHDFMRLLHINGLCRALDGQFKPYKEVFPAHMQVMLAEMEKEPKPDFLEIRNKYRQAVQQWLGEK